jgi:hypothetical protein
VPFWRREKLHERLAREGRDVEPPPHDTTPRWGETGIHGLHRPREWDAVASAELAGPPRDEIDFVVLPDRTLLIDDDLEPTDVVPLANAVESSLAPPYRAAAVRRGPETWAVGARSIEVLQLPEDQDGDELVLSVSGGERSLLVDGLPGFGSVPALERYGAARYGSFVVRARRLDETSWEVEVSPL